MKGILATAVICLLVALATGVIGDETNKSLVAIIALVGVAVTILAGFVKRVATSYTITDRRLHIKRGIVSRTIQETRLERVQNVNYHQTVMQRMLQVGDVDFDTAAGDDYNFVFSGVAEPADVVHMVDSATHRGDGGASAARRRSSASRRHPRLSTRLALRRRRAGTPAPRAPRRRGDRPRGRSAPR